MQAARGSRGAPAYGLRRLVLHPIDADIDLLYATANRADLASALPALDRNNTGERDRGMYLAAAGLNLRDQVRSDAAGPPPQLNLRGSRLPPLLDARTRR